MDKDKEIAKLKEINRILESDYSEVVDTISFLNKRYHEEIRQKTEAIVSERGINSLFLGSLSVNLILVFGIVVALFIL